MRAAFLVTILGLWLTATASRAADPSVWSALVLGTKSDTPKEAPAELRKFNTKLEHVFGYDQFELIGQHTELMDDPLEHWLIPGQNFSLCVYAKPAAKTGYMLKIKLFEDKRLLTHFEANLGPQSPLFIRGPLYAGGQLIIVMMVK